MLILQGHMDMVVTVRPGSGFDPRNDAPRVQVRNGFLCTDGSSSLGADNHLGNAVVLFLLAQGVEHGPLRLLFTVSEERGLRGAARVDPAWLSGAWGLLNTDGFPTWAGRWPVPPAAGGRPMSARWNGSLRRVRRPSGSPLPAGPAATQGTISTGAAQCGAGAGRVPAGAGERDPL